MEGGLQTHQILDLDEKGLQWKMHECMYIMREEKSAPGFKASKHHFTILLGANLTGECKLKPVMVYHAENPHALEYLAL